MAILTDNEIRDIQKYLQAGKPLPDKFRFLLFEDKREVELVWNGKTNEVCNIVMPFQTIEQVDEPRNDSDTKIQKSIFDFGLDERGRQLKGWTNKLIWGDNKLILSSLKNGPLREEIEKQGGIKLIYIDPPFDVGADFSMKIEVGEDNEEFTKEANILEELAYRDTWGKGADSFIAMIYERLSIMHDLLAEDGSIYVHCDWKTSAYMRMILDEIFSKDNFLGDIAWYYYNKMASGTRKFSSAHDRILFYVKNKDKKYTFNPQEEKRDVPVKQLKRKYFEGKAINAKDEFGNVQYQMRDVKRVDDIWRIACLQPADKTQNTGYSTQKPEKLIERIINASSNEGDLVCDFFCGSGTTLAVAEKLGRK